MEIISSCIARDLPIYALTCASLREHLENPVLSVVTRGSDFAKFRNACGSELTLIDENEVLPKMTFGRLREFDLPFLPVGAGWYLQQFLKFSPAFTGDADGDYVIWDADTVLLKPLKFYDEQGRRLQTKASEHHHPYFETFENLLGFPAPREFSFISQQQILSKPILREMLSLIEERFADSEDWTWAIMNGLRGEGSNLFSEYETYGHYEKARYPHEVSYRDLKWTREGHQGSSFPPTKKDLRRLADQGYYFAAFEASSSPRRKLLRKMRHFLQRVGGRK